MAKHWNPRTAQRNSAPYRRPRRREGGGAPGLLLLAAVFGIAVYADVLPIPQGAPAWEEPTAQGPEESYRAEERYGAGDPSGTAERSYRVEKVIDGDTFRVDGAKIRIADIDTPEIRGRCPHEKALAARATKRLKVLLAAGPFALEPVERDEDQYGRKLRIVTRGGESLGDVLVSEGLARTWTGRREPWCTA
jgi:endonuclease YncB( thermonuclease family)